MANKQMSKFLTVRLTPAVHKAFQRKTERFGKTSDVLREIVQAFIDDRLTVKPNPRKGDLYVTRSQD